MVIWCVPSVASIGVAETHSAPSPKVIEKRLLVSMVSCCVPPSCLKGIVLSVKFGESVT